MSGLFIVAGILIALSSIVVLAVKKSGKRVLDAAGRRTITGLIIAGAVVFLLGNSFTIVPTGYSGVRSTFGQISEATMPQGFNFKVPFVQRISLVNNKQQDANFPSQVWGETSERIQVYAESIDVTYQISRERSSWLYAHVSDPSNIIAANLVATAVKDAMVEFTSDKVCTRSNIQPRSVEKLNKLLEEKYGKDTVIVLQVIINNMDFEKSYNEAIANKAVAMQQQEQQAIENETAIAKAEADKTVALTNAQADAEAMLLRAEAQKKANELLSQSLTDQVLASQFYEKWDGKMPSVMGENAVITDIAPNKD